MIPSLAAYCLPISVELCAIAARSQIPGLHGRFEIGPFQVVELFGDGLLDPTVLQQLGKAHDDVLVHGLHGEVRATGGSGIFGVSAPAGLIPFVLQLDPALIRPGRIDLQEHLGFVTPDQARRFFCHFFPAAPEQAVLFARWAGDGRWTMAQLQDHLISHVDDPHTASRPSGKAIAVERNLFSATPS